MPERPNKKATSLGHGQVARKLAGMNAISADEVTAESVPLGWTLQSDGYGKAVWAPPTGGGDGDLKKDGSVPMEADFNLDNNKLVNVADGTDPSDAVNKGQLDAAVAGGGGSDQFSFFLMGCMGVI